jgi:hypothetical protein
MSTQLFSAFVPLIVGAWDFRCLLSEETIELRNLLVELTEDKETTLLGPGRASFFIRITLVPEENVSRFC